MGWHKNPETIWENILERHSRCRGPGTEHARLRHLPVFTAWGQVRGLQKWSSAPTEAIGRQMACSAPWRSRRGTAGPTFHLPSASLAHYSLALGQRDPVWTDRQGWERVPHRASTAGHRVAGAGKADTGRLRRSLFCLSTWSCILNMMGRGSVKGWSRRVSCVDSNVGNPDQDRSEKLMMQEVRVLDVGLEPGQDTGMIPWHETSVSSHTWPLTFCSWQNPLSVPQHKRIRKLTNLNDHLSWLKETVNDK